MSTSFISTEKVLCWSFVIALLSLKRCTIAFLWVPSTQSLYFAPTYSMLRSVCSFLDRSPRPPHLRPPWLGRFHRGSEANCYTVSNVKADPEVWRSLEASGARFFLRQWSILSHVCILLHGHWFDSHAYIIFHDRCIHSHVSILVFYNGHKIFFPVWSFISVIHALMLFRRGATVVIFPA